MTDSPSALLERAAATLERLAVSTTAGIWQARDLPDEPGYANVLVESAQSFGGYSSLFTSSCCGGQCFGHVEQRADAEWIATMSPAVAQPLVEWLRAVASYVGDGNRLNDADRAALSFARQVLGES